MIAAGVGVLGFPLVVMAIICCVRVKLRVEDHHRGRSYSETRDRASMELMPSGVVSHSPSQQEEEEEEKEEEEGEEEERNSG